jgi:DnaJ-domain-containing protein 1
MGIFDRLGEVIKSYLRDEDGRIFGSGSRERPFGDPDLDAAYEELNDYLGGTGGKDWGPVGGSSTNRDWSRSGDSGGNRGFRETWSGFGPAGHTGLPPEELRSDFAELGVPFGASAEDCKAAYKKLLNIHHPDRHAGHPGNFQKATAKSARINAAYDRIEKWRETGRTE